MLLILQRLPGKLLVADIVTVAGMLELPVFKYTEDKCHQDRIHDKHCITVLACIAPTNGWCPREDPSNSHLVNGTFTCSGIRSSQVEILEIKSKINQKIVLLKTC